MAEEANGKKSLIARIAEACDAVGGIEKKGKNEFQNYKYVKAADVAKAIRHELFTRNIVVGIDEKEFTKIGEIPTKGKFDDQKKIMIPGNPMPLMLLRCDVTFYDGESADKLGPLGAFGAAADSGDKAIYKAKTGALKYVLRHIGLIPDEKDDPEADENVDASVEGSVSAKGQKYEQEFDQRAEGEKTLAVFQMDGIQDLCKQHGKTEEQLTEFIQTLGVNRIEKVLKRDFEKVKKWAIAPLGDLTEKLRQSVDIVKANALYPVQSDWARLYASAGERGIQQSEIKQYYTRKYKVISGKELTYKQFQEVEKEVGTWKAPSILAEAD